MNEELLNKIKQDFLILKNIIPDNFKLSQFLKIDFADASKISDQLRGCRENGDIELKIYYLNNIFYILDDALYKMITPGKLNEALKFADCLLFLTIINYKCIGNRPAKKENKKTIENYDFNLIEVKDVMKDIIDIARIYPESAMYIRVITTLFKKYKETDQEMEEKLIISNEKNKESIKQTYRNDLNSFILSIKKQYMNMIMAIPDLKKDFEDRYINNQEIVQDKKKDLIEDVDFKALKHHLLKQISEFSKIRSSIDFVKREGYDVLSIISDIYREQKNFIEVCKQEETAVFNVMSENDISIEEFNLFLLRIGEEICSYLHAKFINPYTKL